MALALGALRVPPPVFWALTLPELTALLHGACGSTQLHEPPPRAAFTALMQRYPD